MTVEDPALAVRFYSWFCCYYLFYSRTYWPSERLNLWSLAFVLSSWLFLYDQCFCVISFTCELNFMKTNVAAMNYFKNAHLSIMIDLSIYTIKNAMNIFWHDVEVIGQTAILGPLYKYKRHRLFTMFYLSRCIHIHQQCPLISRQQTFACHQASNDSQPGEREQGEHDKH